MLGSIATTEPSTSRAERLEALVRRLLGLGVEGELHAAALGRLVAEQVDELGDEQPRVVAGEHGVLGLLDRRSGCK